MLRPTTNEIETLPATVLTTGQVAGIIDSLLTIDSDDRLTEHQYEIGNKLFNELVRQSPESVAIIHGN